MRAPLEICSHTCLATMPRVLNKYKDTIPTGAVYIGRPSKWGNPFPVTKQLPRESAVSLFRDLVEANESFKQEIREELKGKDLVCFCSPKCCHGDVLLEIANKE
jgi:hypothetical protein